MVQFTSMLLATASAHSIGIAHDHLSDYAAPAAPVYTAPVYTPPFQMPQQAVAAPAASMMGMDPMMMFLLMGDGDSTIKSKAEYTVICAGAGANMAACNLQIDTLYTPIGTLIFDCAIIPDDTAAQECLADHQTVHKLIMGYGGSSGGGLFGGSGGSSDMLMMMMMMGGMGGGAGGAGGMAGGMGGMLPLLLMKDGGLGGSGGNSDMLMMMMMMGGMGGGAGGMGGGMGGMGGMLPLLLMKDGGLGGSGDNSDMLMMMMMMGGGMM